MAHSLQEITDVYGNWIKQTIGGGGLHFSESTNYNRFSKLDGYHGRQVVVTPQSLVYDPMAPAPTPGSINSVEQNIINNSSVQQTQTYSETMTAQRTLNWSVTEAISIGIEVSATAGVPSVAQTSEKLTTNFSLSTTQGSSISKTQSWTVSSPVQVPANSVMHCQTVVTTADYNIGWTLQTLMTGFVALWFDDKIDLYHNGDYHWLWFVSIGQVINDCIANNLIDTSGYEVTADLGVLVTTKGVFSGEQGVRADSYFTQGPLPSSAHALTSVAKPVKFSLPMDANGKSAILSGKVVVPEEAVL